MDKKTETLKLALPVADPEDVDLQIEVELHTDYYFPVLFIKLQDEYAMDLTLNIPLHPCKELYDMFIQTAQRMKEEWELESGGEELPTMRRQREVRDEKIQESVTRLKEALKKKSEPLDVSSLEDPAYCSECGEGGGDHFNHCVRGE